MAKTRPVPGLTFSSLMASLFALLLMGMFVQYSEIIVGLTFPAEHALALPAVWTFMIVLFAAALFYALTRLRILNRAELLCVMYVMLTAAPLMTQGFWHRAVSILATNPRQGDFDKMDALNDRLWPHGPNLLEGVFEESNRASLQTEGNVAWETVEYEQGKSKALPVLSNSVADENSVIRIRLAVSGSDKEAIVRGEPYMVSVLVRAHDLGPRANYYCRLYPDGEEPYTDFFQSALPPNRTFLHKTGFRRSGGYGVKFPATIDQYAILEFGLTGAGRLELHDPKLLSVAALEGMYKGKMVVTESELRALPPDARANLIVKPDRMWSWAGVKFVLGGYIPIRDWMGPMLTWTSFVGLILLGTAAMAIIMRKQWLESERYQMPVTRIPLAMMDYSEEGASEEVLPPLWKNRLMWGGFAVALFWMLMKTWNFYNPKVPDMSVRVALQPLFSDPGWGQMWSNVRFEIAAIFLSLCIFMELNVLISIVIGYFLFRGQYWIGEITGLTVDPNYPYHHMEQLGAYLGYALIVIVFTRKYLWNVLKSAVLGKKKADGEALSYRSAVVLLLLSIVGSAAWAAWVGIAPVSMVIFFLLILSIGFVAAKFRTECGTPWGYFTPGNFAAFMVLLGGVSAFGAEAMIFFFIASFFLAPTVFFLIPGAQLEILELGRRWQINPRHLLGVILIGIVGGMVVGAWVFLSNAYSLGGEAARYSWAFDTKWWYFFAYNQDMMEATNNAFGQVAATGETGLDPSWYAFGGYAGLVMIVAIIRQLFAGFWFHPLGLVVGSTNFADYIWGSALTAWVIRSIVVRLGGASTVRTKLQPFFVGFFLGAAVAYFLIGAHAAYLQSIGIEKIYPILKP
jgi:hypothetical protein